MTHSDSIASDFAAGAEKIGIRVIRLFQPRLCTTGIVCTLSGADKMLLEWSILLDGCIGCAFEVIYLDGRTLSGHYEFRRRHAVRPSLTLHLRHLMKQLLEKTTAADDAAVGCCGLRDVGAALAFLARYDVDEFWPYR